MEVKKELYSDGIGQIHFVGGMVRYDYVTIQPNDGAASNVRIIMPPQGFLETYNSMRQLVDKMIEAGILKKTEITEEPAAPKKAARKTAKKK